MEYFVVHYCNVKACQSWRLQNKCVRNGMSIANTIKLNTDVQHRTICSVKQQMDIYRVTNILGG